METKPIVDYSERTVTVDGDILVPKQGGYRPIIRSTKLKVLKIGVKKFHKPLRRHKYDIEIYQLVAKILKNGRTAEELQGMATDPVMKGILGEYKHLFQDELPAGLPPRRTVHYEIIIEEGEKSPHRPMFQLSPDELRAAKQYVDLLIEIRPSLHMVCLCSS